MRLSILIPTMPDRIDVLSSLYAHLVKQATPDIEILLDCNAATGISLKRNSLIKSAKGDYVVWLDDDDWVSDNYVSSVLQALESNPDCVGYWLEYHDQFGIKQAKHSNIFSTWRTLSDSFERCISFLNPVKRSIAIKVPFDEGKTYAEDHDHSMRLKPFLATEVFIDKVMYSYFPGNSRPR